MPFYSKVSGEMVPYTGELPQEAALAIERADDQAIIENLTKGELQPYFAYSYPVQTKEGTKEIIGISVEGANEIARQLGNIKISASLRVEEREGYFYVIVEATDLMRNVTLPAVGRQSKFVLGKGMVPTDQIDETAFVKAVSKATRNGILKVAPQDVIARILQRLDSRVIKQIPAPPSTKELPHH